MKQDKRIDRVPKNTKALTTISHLLTKDDVKEVLAQVAADQNDIEELVCIYSTRDGGLQLAPSTDIAETILILERAKLILLNALNTLEEMTSE